MLNGDGNENSKKINRTNQQNKKNCTCSTLLRTFLCRCFALLKRETTRHVCVWRKCCGSQLFAKNFDFEFLFSFFSPPLIFHLLAASISHFLTATTKFSSFFQRNSSPWFFFLALALSLLSMSLQTSKFSRKNDSPC